MSHHAFLVTVIALILAGVFLAIWHRRDVGREPVDDLPDALHEPLDHRP